MNDNRDVTPWEVSESLGEGDYVRIASEFGAGLIDSDLRNRLEKLAGGTNPFLNQGVFFAHRDLNLALDDLESGKGFYLYTGRGPSGKMHLGHLLPFMFTRWLQKSFDVNLIIQITDDEKFLFRDLEWKQLSQVTRDNILDILSLGFDARRTHILIDSINGSTLYRRGVEVARHINVTLSKAVFGFQDSDNVGKFFFTSIQSVPAFLVSSLLGRNIRCLIPHAIDQDPHFKVSRDVLPKLGYLKPSSIISKFLPSLKGGGKMSSSDPNSGIFLDDTPQVVRKKIMKYAFSGGRDTAEEQRKYGANPDIDFSFNVYKLIEDDQVKVSKIREEYSSGSMLSGELKSLVAEKISQVLAELREKREIATEKYDEYLFSEDRLIESFR
ncbi:MAG: tryptophan--tRNA ligase [Thermoplasmataceae archaeon]